MRYRLALTAAAIVTIAGGFWLWPRPAEEPRPFETVRRPEPIEAQAPAAPRAESTPRTARLPQPAPAGPVRSAADGPRRLRDPITLARALLLHGSRAQAARPTSRVHRVRALRRDLASLARELRAAAAQPADEALSEVRARLDETRSAAAELFPEPSPPPPSPQAGRPTPLAGRMLDLTPPRPAPPGVLDRSRVPIARAQAPEAQLRDLLGAVDAALSESPSDPASLERVAREIDAALVQGQAGRGPLLRYSTARFGNDTP